MSEQSLRVRRNYAGLVNGLAGVLEAARRASARSVNAVMSATYWEMGRRIVEYEQGGRRRAAYGEELLDRLARDLVKRCGRGFLLRNLRNFRSFYLAWPIRQTPSAELGGRGMRRIRQTVSAELPKPVGEPAAFLLPWSHYVRLLSVKDSAARRFYEEEALRGGWSERQLDRQVGSQFYERTRLARGGKSPRRTDGADPLGAEGAIRDPLVLEFLNLKDEYSEDEMEEALLQRLERFLLELGSEFTFVGRQCRLRIGTEWYRVDLLFFHRRLRCLVVIDLKVGKFTHADAGQMHLYLNYAREHWMCPGENPPVGLILCSEQDDALARYALDRLDNKVLAREYRLALPRESQLASAMATIRRRLGGRSSARG